MAILHIQEHRPLFLFACAPRSGSTWLQRLFTAHGVLVWGEGSLLGLVSDVEPWKYWTADTPPADAPNWDLRHFRQHGPEMWMAVLKPEHYVRDAALKVYLETVFSGASRREGYRRWGIKETMWCPVEAEWVRKTWPACNRVFLHRDPVTAFRSRFSGSYTLRPVSRRQGTKNGGGRGIWSARAMR